MPSKIKKYRADELLVAKNLCASRTLAKTLILSGKVFSGTERIDKTAKMLPEDAELFIKQPPKYVSRGGEKLEGFLKLHPFEIKNKIALDVGASTGGFTDCLLQNQVSHVTCLDVGRAQIHNKIAQDNRIVNMEKTNARELDQIKLPHEKYDIIVMDLSFISLKKVMIPVWNRLKMGGYLVALIKPQFEAEKKEVDAGKGIIRDPDIHRRILDDMNQFFQHKLMGCHIIASIPSPITGTDGNQEFLTGLYRNG